ncbi:hypothetical protein [Thermoanaerobacter sp. YS13]|uniref:hypothetical protein n=1 Tax=Thermoanaerobacter sp. YS13 TaxID=1511746 RepID=UPI0005B5248A|nr:hypothetical protein [Thermoanaerobacter sp. YS13]
MLKNWFTKENLTTTLFLIMLMVGVQVLYLAGVISPFVMLNLIIIAINIILAVSLNLVVCEWVIYLDTGDHIDLN